MMSREDNELLTRVEGDAPMGQIMRRHWLPAVLSEELPEPDGDPVRVRLLGEDLVAFRDTNGRVGVIGEQCPHRKASLFYGRNEECGLRCLYHGWKFDVEGNVLEMSSEPEGSGLVARLKHKSYPAHEAHGIVWIYMGPAGELTSFAAAVFGPTPDTEIRISKIVVNCNWAQVLEGAIDSAHSSTLHSSDMVPAEVDAAKATDDNWLRPSTDKAPRLQVERTPYGFQYAAIRRPIVDPETHDYIRTTLFIAPYTVHIPPNNRYRVALMHVPMDDAHTAFYFIAFGSEGTPDLDSWRKFCGTQVGIDVDKTYRSKRTRANDYVQDRQAMRRGNWTGVPGIANQDIVMWETMGPIVDRTTDRLGASDVAVARFRQMMVAAAKTMAAGGPAIGIADPPVLHAHLRSFEGIVPKSTDWRTLTAAPGAAPQDIGQHEKHHAA